MLYLGMKKSFSSPRLKLTAQGMAQCTNDKSRVWYHSAIQAPQLIVLIRETTSTSIRIWFCVNFDRSSEHIFNGPSPASYFPSFVVFFKQAFQYWQLINIKNIHQVYAAVIRTHDH